MTAYTLNPSALPAPYMCGDAEPLDARTVAEATGTPPARVEGLLGPFTVAHVSVSQDMDAEHNRPHEWAIPDDAAVYVARAPRHGSATFPHMGDGFPRALDYAWDVVVERYGSDDDMGLRVFARYAARHGYTVREASLSGYSQGDWLDLIVVERTGGDSVDVDTLNDWFAGDVYVVSVEVAHPFGGTVMDAVGDVYGDDGARRVTAELLADLMESIRADVRASA